MEFCWYDGKVWEGEVLCNLLIKSLYFCEFGPLGCDLHECVSTGIVSLSSLNEIEKLKESE